MKIKDSILKRFGPNSQISWKALMAPVNVMDLLRAKIAIDILVKEGKLIEYPPSQPGGEYVYQLAKKP
jgi:hypothetical protein